MTSAPFVVIAAIFKSKFDDRPVRLKELQFWMSKLIGKSGSALAAPDTVIPIALGCRTPIAVHAGKSVSDRSPPREQQVYLLSVTRCTAARSKAV
jgi:hypothetical protein